MGITDGAGLSAAPAKAGAGPKAPGLLDPLTIHVAGEAVALLPSRAAYWPSARTLLVADLHLGKAESFRVHGAPVPDGVLRETLARLDETIDATGAQRLLILGDLLHAPAGLTRTMIDSVASWRAFRPSLRACLVAGNHDGAMHRVAEAWSIEELGPLHAEGPFAFVHEPVATRAPFTWAGHLHPAAVLRGRADSLKLPCFHIGTSIGVLPAFSLFTAGGPLRRAAADRLFAIAEGQVLEV